MNGKQDNYFKFVILFLLFLLLAFDRDLAMVYILIMFGDYIWYKSDKFISFPISEGKSNNIMIYVESVAALGVFLVISTILVNFFNPGTISTGFIDSAQSIFRLLSTATPLLQGSKILTIIGWGILIPIIETSFWNGRLLEGFTTFAEKKFGLKISLQKFSTALFMVIIVVAALFTLFHITAKGIETIPLIITFVFSIISSVLVIRHQELKGAILVHILTNSAAVASSLGWF